MYRIYELEEKRKVSNTIGRDYEYYHKLLSLNLPHYMEDTYPTMEAAENFVKENPDIFKHKTLTILPVMRLSWEGELI